jgi:hypothetical protein
MSNGVANHTIGTPVTTAPLESFAVTWKRIVSPAVTAARAGLTSTVATCCAARVATASRRSSTTATSGARTGRTGTLQE